MTLSAAPKFALQKVRTSQPQGPCAIDRSNPICRGLIFTLSPADAIANKVVGSSPLGSSLHTTTTDVNFMMKAFPRRAYSSLSFMLLSRTTARSSYAGLIISRDSVGAASYGINFSDGNASAVLTNSNPMVNMHGPDWNTQDTAYSSSSVNNQYPLKGTKFIYSWGIDSYSGRGRLFRDGVELTGYANTKTTLCNLNSSSFGGFLSVTAGSTTDTNLLVVWDRALSDAEIKSLSDNPWQIYKPDALLLPAPSTGTQTIQPNNLSYEVNWSDPITNALKMALIPEDSHFNYATSRAMAVASGTYTHGVSKSGRGASTLGNSPGVVYANSETEALRNQPEGSFLIVCDVIAPTGNADTNQHVLLNLDGGNWYMGVNAYGYSDQKGLEIRFYATNYPSQTAVFTEGNYFNNKKYCVIVATYKNSGTAYFYDHGGLLGTAPCPAQNLVNGELPAAICVGKSAALGIHNITLAATFARQLTDTEARNLASNPWQIFKAKTSSIAAHEVVTPRKSYMLGGSSPAPSTAAILTIPRRVRTTQPQGVVSVANGWCAYNAASQSLTGFGQTVSVPNTAPRATMGGICGGAVNVNFSPLKRLSIVEDTSSTFTLVGSFVRQDSGQHTFGFSSVNGYGFGLNLISTTYASAYGTWYGVQTVNDINSWTSYGSIINIAVSVQWVSKSVYNFYTQTLYVNGKYFSSTIGAGYPEAFTKFAATDTVLMAGICSGRLSDKQLLNLSLNPWQIFAPDNTPIWGPA